jgi:hypothetical protein
MLSVFKEIWGREKCKKEVARRKARSFRFLFFIELYNMTPSWERLQR